MANNEIKVTIKADNKQFLNALAACSKKLIEFTKSANNIQIKDPAPIHLTVDDSGAKGTVKEMQASMEALKEQKISIEADSTPAMDGIKRPLML